MLKLPQRGLQCSPTHSFLHGTLDIPLPSRLICTVGCHVRGLFSFHTPSQMSQFLIWNTNKPVFVHGSPSPCTSLIKVGMHYNITESSFLGENASALLMVLTLMLLLWLHKYLLHSRMSEWIRVYGHDPSDWGFCLFVFNFECLLISFLDPLLNTS